MLVFSGSLLVHSRICLSRRALCDSTGADDDEHAPTTNSATPKIKAFCIISLLYLSDTNHTPIANWHLSPAPFLPWLPNSSLETTIVPLDHSISPARYILQQLVTEIGLSLSAAYLSSLSLLALTNLNLGERNEKEHIHSIHTEYRHVPCRL